MLFWGNRKSVSHGNIGKYVRSYAFQRLFIGIITVILAFILVDTGAAPKKYRLTVGAASTYDINAPRDIENKLKTEENAKAAASAVEPVMKVITAASLEVYRSMDDFIAIINEARNSIAKKLEATGLGNKDAQYAKLLETETEAALIKVSQDINKSGIPLSTEQIRYLLSKVNDGEISAFSKICRDVITDIMKDDITEDNLILEINKAQNQFESKEINQDLKNIGAILVKSILKPNRIIDAEATKKRKEEVYNRQENIVKILKGERIISFGDTVTPDKYAILEELKLIEAKGSFDIVFSIGILLLILLLALILLLYMNRFCKSILHNRDDILILCLNILLVLTIARWVSLYSALAIPIFIATMTISIIMDIKLSIIVNFILTAAIGLMTKGSADFIYISLISGTLSAFLVNKANQRSKLSAAGLLIGFVNALIVVCLGLINKSGFADIVSDAAIVFLNGILSIILTIGMLPFWETTFNVITPLKLLELANPNQPLLKRLLMEAPGTYHHSLMVGNLAEVATEAIGGDALLARVGAYFHDVGKLARPNFFKENQLSDNPHDKITPNLSTLIITSHATDGTELAKKHKIPLAIRDIISQHHGTTLVAYFYHKASKGDKGDQVKQENFRYEGPRPASKEAAVVMVADSVEAAVRSMADKTEGKMEGLIRKIIKDKLDDGQFDLCDLTLKDLDIIARSFLRVFSGYFHERQQYPDIRVKSQELEKIESIDEKILTEEEQKGKKVSNGNTD